MKTLTILRGRWNGRAKAGSSLSMTGQWLAKAGFHPGSKVEVNTETAGQLTIKVIGSPTLHAEDFQAVCAQLDRANGRVAL